VRNATLTSSTATTIFKITGGVYTIVTGFTECASQPVWRVRRHLMGRSTEGSGTRLVLFAVD